MTERKNTKHARLLGWHTGRLPNRRGMGAYVVLIRDVKNDPEETKKRGAIDNPGGVSWKQVDKHSPEEWRRRIVRLLADGVPRTFNHIAIALSGHTADVVFQKNPEIGLWLAVERGEIEHTNEAPILFRSVHGRRKTIDPEKPADKPAPVLSPAERIAKRGKTIRAAPKKKNIRGYTVYDGSTIKKQSQGRRIGSTLLFTRSKLEDAKADARTWTITTGHATSVYHNGLPVMGASYNWNEAMAHYTKGWQRGKTIVTDQEKTGIFYGTKPSTGAADSGYLASVLWDDSDSSVWTPLVGILPVSSHLRKKIAAPDKPTKPSGPLKSARPFARKQRITAKEIIDPVLGKSHQRLISSVDEAIRLYGKQK